jgi:hypothetical protein
MAIPCYTIKIKGLNELPVFIARYDWIWWMFIERGRRTELLNLDKFVIRAMNESISG